MGVVRRVVFEGGFSPGTDLLPSFLLGLGGISGSVGTTFADGLVTGVLCVFTVSDWMGVVCWIMSAAVWVDNSLGSCVAPPVDGPMDLERYGQRSSTL